MTHQLELLKYVSHEFLCTNHIFNPFFFFFSMEGVSFICGASILEKTNSNPNQLPGFDSIEQVSS